MYLHEIINDYFVFLQQDQHTFDQTPHGWRSLVNNNPTPADFVNAAKLIDTYISQNHPHDTAILLWHAGQMYAFAHDYKNAIVRMKQTHSQTDPQWNQYADATIAFLKNDRDTFEQLYSSLRDNYNRASIERLRQGFGKPYDQVY